MTDLSYGQLIQGGDTHWQQFNDDMDVEVIFDQPTDFSTVTVNSIRHTLHGLYAPKQIEVYADIDGQYRKVGDTGFMEKSMVQGRNVFSDEIACGEIEGATRIRIVASIVNPIPLDLMKPGQKSFIKIDEIIVL